MRRVGERHRAALVRAVELRPHVGTATRLVGSRTEVGARRVWHLPLVARLRISATTAALVRVAPTSGARAHVVAHIAVCGLGGFATEVLRAGTERSLRSWTQLCEQRVKTWRFLDKLLRGRISHARMRAMRHRARTPQVSTKRSNTKETGDTTYVVITGLPKATEVGHVSCLIGRWWWATAARGGLWDRRRRCLGRSHTRVHRRSTQARLRLAGCKRRVAHIGRALLIGEAKLKTIGTAGGTTVGHVARGTSRGDGDGRLPGVIALGCRRSSRGAIDDGNTRSCGGSLLRLLVLHGFAVHRRHRSRLPMLCRATHGDGSGSRVRRGLLRGVGVGPRRRRGSRGQGGRSSGRRGSGSGALSLLNARLRKVRCH